MKIPRDLSGAELVATLCRKWGYREVHQRGSHIILETDTPAPQRIAIPAHDALRIGTLFSLLRSVANHKGVQRQDLLNSL